jgi:hypothetical protein
VGKAKRGRITGQGGKAIQQLLIRSTCQQRCQKGIFLGARGLGIIHVNHMFVD